MYKRLKVTIVNFRSALALKGMLKMNIKNFLLESLKEATCFGKPLSSFGFSIHPGDQGDSSVEKPKPITAVKGAEERAIERIQALDDAVEWEITLERDESISIENINARLKARGYKSQILCEDAPQG